MDAAKSFRKLWMCSVAFISVFVMLVQFKMDTFVKQHVKLNLSKTQRHRVFRGQSEPLKYGRADSVDPATSITAGQIKNITQPNSTQQIDDKSPEKSFANKGVVFFIQNTRRSGTTLNRRDAGSKPSAQFSQLSTTVFPDDEIDSRFKNGPIMYISQPYSSVFSNNIYYGIPVRNKTFKLLLLRSANGFRYNSSKNNFAGCPYDNCQLLTSVQRMPEADAIMTHMGNISNIRKSLLAANRKPHQLWLAHFLESEQRRFRKVFKHYNGLYNVTSFQERSADIYSSYGYYDRRIDELVDDVNKINVTRPKLVAWFVSNCRTPSRREDYVRELRKYIHVDVYGRCGNLNCDKIKADACYEMLEINYKFYLAFENSLCVDYLTEKIWNILSLNVVPVVLGGADYKLFLPPHSYIDVRDFKSPKQLAHYLFDLNSNDTLYRQYFEWKHYFEVHRIRHLCQICAFMNRADNSTHMVVDRLDKFYDPKRHCETPQAFYNDPAVLKKAKSAN